jgi:hypothetical protein
MNEDLLYSLDVIELELVREMKKMMSLQGSTHSLT